MPCRDFYRHRWLRRLVLSLLLTAGMLLAGCGGMPIRSSPPSVRAPMPAEAVVEASHLARIAADSLPPKASSGFRLLPQPEQAFEAREALIARAELTIDAQYYFIADDSSGRAFLDDLETAAARGVRVRLLVDDFHTAEIEATLARLARAPGMEVRLFNPFCCARETLFTRLVASLGDLARLDRRMHNKLLVVDRRLALAGGRNIADPYFAHDPRDVFLDIDALMAGTIVSQLEAVFERYWRSDAVWPAADLVRAPAADAQPVRPVAARGFAEVPERDALGQAPVGRLLEAGRLDLVPGTAFAFADSPSKAVGDDDDYLQETSVLTRARETILTAQSEVLIASPYFIPRARGLSMIEHLRDRGVRLRVLTNGASSNDSLFAYAGYARYRHRILELETELHELRLHVRPMYPASPAPQTATRLHAKTFVIDRETVFIGSTNFDPRSSDRNTELGVLIDSPDLAAQMIRVVDGSWRPGTVRVQLDPSGMDALRWTAPEASDSVLDTEPERDLLDRITEFLLFPWVPESML